MPVFNPVCRTCECTRFYLAHRGMQIGCYCASCGSWIKWVGKADLKTLQARGMRVNPEGYVHPEVQRNIERAQVSEQHSDARPPFDSDPIPMSRAEHTAMQRRPADYTAEEQIPDWLKTVEGDTGKPRLDMTDTAPRNVTNFKCPVCVTGRLERVFGTKVEATVVDGVLSILGEEGELLGCFKLEYCPSCGKEYK